MNVVDYGVYPPVSKKLPTPALATRIPIEWERVKSTTIQAVSYHKESKTMHVLFVGGGAYELTSVPAHRHHAFMHAESKGRYYALTFKNNLRYPARRIDSGVPTVLSKHKGPEPLVTEAIVATPLYLALTKTKKMLVSNPLLANRLLYILWSACGKENTGLVKPGGNETRYGRCLSLIAEASGCNKTGEEYLDGAIALAAERKL
jgi:hypothetical protein